MSIANSTLFFSFSYLCWSRTHIREVGFSAHAHIVIIKWMSRKLRHHMVARYLQMDPRPKSYNAVANGTKYLLLSSFKIEHRLHLQSNTKLIVVNKYLCLVSVKHAHVCGQVVAFIDYPLSNVRRIQNYLPLPARRPKIEKNKLCCQNIHYAK